MSLTGFTSFGFAQNTIHDFRNTVLNSMVALSSTNATKTAPKYYLVHLSSVPDDKILDWSKLKQIADDILK